MIAEGLKMSESEKSAPLSKVDSRVRNAYLAIWVLLFAAAPAILIFLYFGAVAGQWQLFVIAGAISLASLATIPPYRLIKSGKSDRAMIILAAQLIAVLLVISFLVEGLGLIISLAALITTIAVSSLAMQSKYSLPGIFIGITISAALYVIDLSLQYERLRSPQLLTYTPIIDVLIAVPFLIAALRQFNQFSLRTKIASGILVTGGLAIATLTYYGLNSANSIVSDLAAKFENSIVNQTETEIKKIIQTEADKADALFSKHVSDLASVAEYRAQIETQSPQFSLGAYWNSSEKVFQLADGQYGNFGVDAASVYIPNTYIVDEAMLADLNTTAYLDFLVPKLLETHPDFAAVYYISTLGYTTYYPNINLAQNIPPDFDPTQETFFTIATPKNNPEREPRWTTPYQDPAGAGLIVTLSIPVYTNSNIFIGVISADIQLVSISTSVSNIKLGESGFSILVDKNGLILAMPEQGYALFGLQPEIIPLNESPKQTILGRGPDEIQALTSNILNGETGLTTITVNGIESYAAYTPLETMEYRLAVFAPVNELNREIITSREEVQSQVESSLQKAAIILISLFLGAFLVSLWAGQVITSPLKRLTKTVEQITGGNLSARVKVESQDEIGTLASSFNTMAERLSSTLMGLEERIAERTTELEKISESNAYRASRFESVARISHTISSTQTLDELLPQTSEIISEQLGFYHVGIFLLDTRREYAVLTAANSQGGKNMLKRNHRLQVGETGIVGFVTKTGQPRIALDVGLDAVYFNNPDLPETHSEIALPLRIGSEVFGALDVQSTITNAFTQEDINILSTLADQVSVAIQNTRSYQQSLEALARAESIAAQMSEQQWSQFLERQSIQGYHFDGVKTKQLKSSDNKQVHNLAIPLKLRGIQIGALKLSTSDPSRTWTEDEIAMAQATADRTALAIENARLLQEARKRASKEETIGQISAKIGSLVNIENILKTTIQELGNTLPGTDIAIQFTPRKSEQ